MSFLLDSGFGLLLDIFSSLSSVFVDSYNDVVEDLTHFDLKQIMSAFMVLFAVIDPIGAIPIIISLKQKEQKIEPFRTAFISFCILVAFLFIGQAILSLFGVDISSFAVAGALILFVLALEMIFGVEFFKNDSPDGKGSVLVPLVFPLIAGAASFTTLLSLRAEYAVINILFAILFNMVVIFIVLKYVFIVERLLGKGGVYVLRKFFGIILLAIAVRLFMQNINSLLSSF